MSHSEVGLVVEVVRLVFEVSSNNCVDVVDEVDVVGRVAAVTNASS